MCHSLENMLLCLSCIGPYSCDLFMCNRKQRNDTPGNYTWPEMRKTMNKFYYYFTTSLLLPLADLLLFMIDLFFEGLFN